MDRRSSRTDFHLLEELVIVKTVQDAVLEGGCVHVETRKLPDKDIAETISTLITR